MNLLVVEDDEAIAGLIASGLRGYGHRTTTTFDGETALANLREGTFDAVVLDRMLPGMDGLDVLQRIRSSPSHPPVLVLSAMGDIDHRVEGIEAGADDYLVKPFDMMELNARLNAIARRVSRANDDLFRIGSIEVNIGHHKASRGDRPLNLNRKEFGLLIELMQHCDRTVTRRMLLERVWGYSFEPGTTIIESNMSRLRSKLTQFGEADPIATVRGAGYVFQRDCA
ncbi:MAG: response regulator transcription factor [Sphingomonas sp.]